jgi:hypothetical protein
MKAKIELQINNKVIKCLIDYEFTPGVPAKLYGLPENCYPAEPEEWEIMAVTVLDYCLAKDANAMAGIEGFLLDCYEEDILAALEDLELEEPDPDERD